MTTTTTYGTWNNHGDHTAVTVKQSVVNALTYYAHEYDVDGLTDAYRDAINAALPEGVTLCGEEFIGPAYEQDRDWPTSLNYQGSLDIARIVDQVDLEELAEKHLKAS